VTLLGPLEIRLPHGVTLQAEHVVSGLRCALGTWSYRAIIRPLRLKVRNLPSGSDRLHIMENRTVFFRDTVELDGEMIALDLELGGDRGDEPQWWE